MKIYRIENPNTMVGMWYTIDSQPSNYIYSIDGISKDLPMPYEPEHYGQGGKKWFSGCHEKELMFHWFSLDDVKRLAADGYLLYEFEASEYQVEEYQTIFTREGIVSQRVIPYSDIWHDYVE